MREAGRSGRVVGASAKNGRHGYRRVTVVVSRALKTEEGADEDPETYRRRPGAFRRSGS
jgi:hypothetical protein